MQHWAQLVQRLPVEDEMPQACHVAVSLTLTHTCNVLIIPYPKSWAGLGGMGHVNNSVARNGIGCDRTGVIMGALTEPVLEGRTKIVAASLAAKAVMTSSKTDWVSQGAPWLVL